MLSPRDREVFEHRLVTHAECRDVLGTARTFLAGTGRQSEAGVPERAIKRAIGLYRERQGVADLVLRYTREMLQMVRTSVDVSLLPSAPVPAIRSNSNSGQSMTTISKKFESVLAEVAVERTLPDRCTIHLTVTEHGAGAPFASGRVEVASAGREIASCLLSRGRAVFEDIGTGVYDITIRRRDAVLGKIRIAIEQ